MRRPDPRAGAFALALLAAPAAAQQELPPDGAPAVESAPFTEEDAAQRLAPQTQLDWRALEDLDARDYVDRLAALDGLAMAASQLALDRKPRERTTNVAQDILDAHRFGRAVAQELLPESEADATLSQEDAATLAELREATRLIAFEEAYIDAMIEAHREAAALTSFYRRFGSNEEVREFARRILPMLEASLYQAVTIRQELVAEFIAARGGG